MITKAKLIKRVRDAVNPHLRFLRIRRFFGETFTVPQYSPPNMDSCPHRDAKPLAENIGEGVSQVFVRSFTDGVARKSEEGEAAIYATKDGLTRIAEVYLKNDGTITLNGSDHFGVIKIVELTAKINALIAELQAHTHGGSAPTTTFTKFVKEDYENTTVLHGSGEGI